MGNEVAVDQPITTRKVDADTGEETIGSVAAVKAATAAEVAKTSITDTSSAIVVATAVAVTVAVAVVAAA